MNKKLNIAVLLPSLDNKGSLIVAKDIVNNTILDYPDFANFTVFYFDEIFGLDLNCDCKQINYKGNFLFENFDIIHSHGYRPDLYLAKRLSKIDGKIISTIHCDVFDYFKIIYNYFISIFFGKKWINALKKKNLVITLTKFHYYKYAKFINQDKLKVIYNSRLIDNDPIPKTDIDFFQSLRKKYINHNIIGAFAVLTPVKGLDQVIKALPNLKKHLFIVMGEGPEMKKLKALSIKLGVSDRVFFLGYKKDANRYMKFIDVYVQPSHTEAFPLSLIEACYSGVSSVCSNIPVLEEVYTDDEVTFFELDNIKSLQYGIERATKEKATLGANAKSKTLNSYSMKQMVENYMNVYKDLVK